MKTPMWYRLKCPDCNRVWVNALDHRCPYCHQNHVNIDKESAGGAAE